MTKVSTRWILAEAAVQSPCSDCPEGGQVQDGGGQGIPWTLMLGNSRWPHSAVQQHNLLTSMQVNGPSIW